MPQARPLTAHKPLWELRPMPNRLIHVAISGKQLVFLHAFREKKPEDAAERNNYRRKALPKATV